MVPQAALAQMPAPVTFVQFAGQTVPGLGATGAWLANPEVRPINIAHPERSVALGLIKPIDTQGNGRPDLFVCHFSFPPDDPIPQPCRFLRPQADGSLIEVTRKLLGPGPLPAAVHPREVIVADFNRDGLPDIFLAAHGYDAPPYPGEANVLLLSNGDGNYTDRSSTLPPVSDFTHSACVGDVNGDGYLDIYAGNVDNRIKPYFLLGNGDGTFTQTKGGLPTSIADLLDAYTSCLIADLDRDGHPELVLGYFGGLEGRPQENLILWNDGAGDFTNRPRYALPPNPLGNNNFITLDIVVLDANRDGRPDLLVLSSSKVGASGFDLQMLINRGDGTFVDETAARIGPSAFRPSGPWCAFITLADLNGDGFEDFYCDNLYGGETETVSRYWLNNRIGGWTPIVPDSLPGGLSSGFIQIVDFDGDGSQDLVNVGQMGPDIWYSSFRNVTVRTVPSEPIIRGAAAGDAQASISFTPPLASGASPITGYTATCTQGTRPGTFIASGPASPLAVTGLSNGKPHLCSVTASSAAGTSLPSKSVSVRPLANSVDKYSAIEFYNASLDHYFITYVADEIAKLDNGTFKGWARTGETIKAYLTPQATTSAVCRIYIPPGKGDGHFFGRDNGECDGTMNKNPTFVLESATFFHLYLPKPWQLRHRNGADLSRVHESCRRQSPLHGEPRDARPNGGKGMDRGRRRARHRGYVRSAVEARIPRLTAVRRAATAFIARGLKRAGPATFATAASGTTRCPEWVGTRQRQVRTRRLLPL